MLKKFAKWKKGIKVEKLINIKWKGSSVKGSSSVRPSKDAVTDILFETFIIESSEMLAVNDVISILSYLSLIILKISLKNNI